MHEKVILEGDSIFPELRISINQLSERFNKLKLYIVSELSRVGLTYPEKDDIQYTDSSLLSSILFSFGNVWRERLGIF